MLMIVDVLAPWSFVDSLGWKGKDRTRHHFLLSALYVHMFGRVTMSGFVMPISACQFFNFCSFSVLLMQQDFDRGAFGTSFKLLFI
jgi:hypothetical protein